MDDITISIDEEKILEDLKGVKDYSMHIIVVFFLQLITIVYTSMKQ